MVRPIKRVKINWKGNRRWRCPECRSLHWNFPIEMCRNIECAYYRLPGVMCWHKQQELKEKTRGKASLKEVIGSKIKKKAVKASEAVRRKKVKASPVKKKVKAISSTRSKKSKLRRLRRNR